MHPVIEAILFLLREAHASGNYPQSEAQLHIDAIEEDFRVSRESAAAQRADSEREKESEQK